MSFDPVAELEKLRLEYAARLPIRLKYLKTAYSSFIDHPNASGNLDNFIRYCKSLLGPAQASKNQNIIKLSEQLLDLLLNLPKDKLSKENSQIAAIMQAIESNISQDSSQDVFIFEVVLLSNDKQFANEVTTKLKLYEYKVCVYSSLEEAFTKLQQNSHCALVIDADSLKPKISDALLKKIKKLKKLNLLTIYLTKEDNLDHRLFAITAKIDLFLTKPIDSMELINNIELLSFNPEVTAVKVLVISNNADNICSILEQNKIKAKQIKQANNLNKALIDFHPDTVIVDVNQGDYSGFDLARVINSFDAFISLPIIFLFSLPELKVNLKYLTDISNYFLLRDMNANLVLNVVEQSVRKSRKLNAFMYRDSLTNLLNHARILEQLDIEFARSLRSNTPICFAMIDLDNFKKINDTYGHQVGDRVIKDLAIEVKKRLRQTDSVGRYGGEEFAIILPATKLADAVHLLNDIRVNFSTIRHKLPEGEFSVTFSGGVVCQESKDIFTTEDMVEAADSALYIAKKQGKNKIIAYSFKEPL